MPTIPNPFLHATLHRRRFLQAGGALALMAALGNAPRPAMSQATPTSGTLAKSSTLVDMFRLVPASVYIEAGGTEVWDYMDQAQQLASRDVPIPTLDVPFPSGYLPATYPLWTSAAAYLAATRVLPDPSKLGDLVATTGFFPLAAGQCLAVGVAPDSMSIYRGGIDLDRVAKAWADHGYEQVTASGGSGYWTLGEWNPDDPVQEYTFGQLNNLAVIGEFVVASGSSDLLERVVAAQGGSEPSILDNPEIANTVAGMPAETVSAIGGWPSTAPAMPDDGFMAEQATVAAESGPMPLYLTIVAGITAGLSAPVMADGTPTPVEPAPGTGLAVVRLGTATEADADQAARVAAYRWESSTSIATNEPFVNSMRVQSAGADGTVAEIVFDRVRRPAAWRYVFVYRDNFPFAPC
jgi:hypothetical protein